MKTVLLPPVAKRQIGALSAHARVVPHQLFPILETAVANRSSLPAPASYNLSAFPEHRGVSGTTPPPCSLRLTLRGEDRGFEDGGHSSSQTRRSGACPQARRTGLARSRTCRSRA